MFYNAERTRHDSRAPVVTSAVRRSVILISIIVRVMYNRIDDDATRDCVYKVFHVARLSIPFPSTIMLIASRAKKRAKNKPRLEVNIVLEHCTRRENSSTLNLSYSVESVNFSSDVS